MSRTNSIRTICISALLIAVGIIIPMFSPFKIVLEPASYTLGSHIAIMLAMMISPLVAVSVAIGTTMGFLLGGFPLVIVLRAATHLVFAVIGAFYLQAKPETMASPVKIRIFSFCIGLIHALCEVLVVSAFFFGGAPRQDYVHVVLGLVGIGTVIHSMVDFEIALVIEKVLSKQNNFAPSLK